MANTVLFSRAQQYYREVNDTRLDPVGLSKYPQSSSLNSPSDDLRLVMFGDSRAQGWNLSTVEGYEFINRGISSQTSAQVLARFTAHVETQDPDIIVLQVGINDLKTIGLFPDRAADIISRYQANMEQLVALSEETGAAVVVSSILPAGKIPLIRKPFWSEAVDQAVVDMNLFLAELAERREKDGSVFFFDGAGVLTEPTEGEEPNLPLRIPAAYQIDDLHLNQEGYDALNEAFLPWLQALNTEAE